MPQNYIPDHNKPGSADSVCRLYSYDAQGRLHYLNARYYDPENGRFISQDSYRGEMNDPGQWHLYAYCANNPVNYVDPSGHWSKALHRKIAGQEFDKTKTKKLVKERVQYGSEWPDKFKKGKPRFHGKHSSYKRIQNKYYKKAKKKYKKKAYRTASKYLGIAIHTTQDYSAHNITYKGKLTWWKDIPKDVRDEWGSHSDTFDNVDKYYSKKWKDTTEAKNSRVKAMRTSTKNLIVKFMKAVG